MTRLVSMLAFAALVATACAGDDQTPSEALDIATTVPEVTAAPDDPTGVEESDGDETVTPGEAEAAADDPPAAGDPADLLLADVSIELVVELDAPIDAVVAPNGEWWIAQRGGQVIVVDPDTGEIGDTLLDIDDELRTGGERGLLGLAVDDAALYANFTDLDGNTHVEAFLLDGDGRPAERVVLLTIDQPFRNHNGGGLAIGPDGHLYISVGDGGGADDPLEAGQDPDTALGKILRIAPTPADPNSPYTVPADNPYAQGGGVAEAFLIGVRNPWRMSFDDATGDFWIADVGQNRWEEITLLLGANGWGLGANLGWNLREGIETFRGDRPQGNVDPVFVYGHSGDIQGCSITGGEVYRGSAIPDLVGAYVFGDYCTADLWAISVASGEVVFVDLDVAMPGGELVDFSIDPDGELVALSLSGAVVRLVAS